MLIFLMVHCSTTCVLYLFDLNFELSKMACGAKV